jgi:hypothetical protein
MRAWPLHVVFLIILVGSLAVREGATDVLAESGNLEPAIISVARSHGLVFRKYTTLPGGVRALMFEATGCSRSVLVIMLAVTFDQQPTLVLSAREHGDVLRYVYIDRTWDKPDRVVMFVERMKYAALATFGLTEFVPSWHLLLIRSPSQCHVADAIDWRLVWKREHHQDANTADPAQNP